MITTRGKLWYAINTNCGFINFHPHGFWTDSKGVERHSRQSNNLQSATLIAVYKRIKNNHDYIHEWSYDQ